MDALEQRLQQMQANMAQQMEDYQPGGGNFDPIPEGEYSFIMKPVLKLSKGGKLMVEWTIILSDGDFRGRKIFENTVLEGNEGPSSINQAGSHICRRYVEACGKEWPEAKQLIQLKRILAEIDSDESVLSGNIKQKPGMDSQYTNYSVYPNSPQDFSQSPASEAPADDSPAEAPADDSPVEAPADDSPAEAPADKVPQRPLLDFCTKYDINGIDENDSDETIIASLVANGFTFKTDEITPDEVDLLMAFPDGENLIVGAEPPKPIVAPKQLSRGKAPAKPAPKTPAKAPAKGKGKR